MCCLICVHTRTRPISMTEADEIPHTQTFQESTHLSLQFGPWVPSYPWSLRQVGEHASFCPWQRSGLRPAPHTGLETNLQVVRDVSCGLQGRQGACLRRPRDTMRTRVPAAAGGQRGLRANAAEKPAASARPAPGAY